MQTPTIAPSVEDFPVIPLRRATVVQNVLDLEAVLFDPANGATHRLNETALAVWNQCNGTTSTQQMADRLCDDFDVDPETALQHVEQLIVVFAEVGLLEKDQLA